MALHRKIRVGTEDEAPYFGMHFGPATVYLDTVQAIVDVLTEHGTRDDGVAPEVFISLGDFRADEVDDLRDARRDELKTLRLSVQDFAYVRLWEDLAGLSVPNTPEGKTLGRAIAARINEQRTWRDWLWVSRPIQAILATLLALALLFYLWNPSAGETDPWAVPVAAGLLFCVVAVGWVTMRTRRFVVRVVPQRPGELRGLSRETRRALSIAVAAALIGAVAGAGLTALLI